MNILQRLFYKASEARIVNSYQLLHQYAPSQANYDTYSKEGYQKVVMVYRCINEIVSACKGIEWELYSVKGNQDRTELINHPMLDLMKKPNPLMGQAQMMEALISFYLISGNTFLEAVRPSLNQPPRELWPITSPQNMKIIVGVDGYPEAYEYQANGKKKKWEMDFVDFKCDIMHLKTFNPTNIWWGLSPLQVGIQAIDSANAAATWNISLMKNMATPSGVLSVKTSDANPTGAMTKEQKDNIREEIDRRYSGLRNAGRPMLLEGGLQWQSIALSPKDMDFLNSKNVNANDIALIYGVPGEIVGLGTKTFNNYAEARAAFYTNTVLPLMDFIRDEFNRWLTPAFGDNLTLDYNKDDIEALYYLRKEKLTTLNTVSFLDINEKRAAAGYAPKEGWDVLNINNGLGATPEEISLGAPLSIEGEGATETTSEDPSVAVAAGVPASNTALNGAQVTSLLEVITAVVEGRLPRGSAIAIIVNAFNVSSEQAESMLGDVGRGFVPEVPPTDPGTSVDSSEEDTGEDELEEDSKMRFKSVNLINPNEKRKSWRAQNARRKRDTIKMNRDLIEDFNEMTSKMRYRLKQNDNPNTAEVTLLQVIDDMAPVFEATLKRHIKYTSREFGLSILGEGKSLPGVIEKKASVRFESYIKDFVNRRAFKALQEIQSTSTKKARDIARRLVLEAIEEGQSGAELTDKFMDEFENLTPARARTIARTEVTIASTNGAYEAAKSLEIPGLVKEWVSANDDRVRDDLDHADHRAMNGVSVGLEDKFTVPPDADMNGPGDESAEASQVVNCRCVLVYNQRG